MTNIRETNRGSKGVKLIGLSDRDHLVGVSEVVMLDEDTEGEESSDTTKASESSEILAQEEV